MTTLGEYFLREVAMRVARKRLLGGYVMPMGSMMVGGLWVFQKGAILGRARRRSLEAVVALIGERGCPTREVAQAIKQSAQERVRRASSKDALTFREFWFQTEYPNIAFGDPEVLRYLARRKVRLAEALTQAPIWAADGVGFGAAFPEVTESMWRHSYEVVRPEAWDHAGKAGVELPDGPTTLPLEEMERQVLDEVRVFAEENRPEILESLE